MAEEIKWGVMGNAAISRVCMIPAIQKSSNGSVHALATRSPARARQVAADHQIDQIYNSYDALLVDAAIDAVYIALPNHLHHPRPANTCCVKSLWRAVLKRRWKWLRCLRIAGDT
jgi:xylose dehydrogenase (NAD/NADP)